MKRLVPALLTFLLLLSACAPAPEVTPTPTPAPEVTPTPTPMPIPTSAVTPTPTSTPEPSQEPPLTAEELSLPVPDFLTPDQQALYRRAYALYVNAFGGYSRNLDAIGVTDPEARLDVLSSQPAVTIDGAPYLLSVGRYQNWEDFDRVVHSLFTDRFWNEVNHTEPTSDGDLPRFVSREDGRLCFLDLEWFQDGSYNEHFPDTFRLEEQTDTSVTFTLIGHYSDIYPQDGETPEDRDARLVRQYDYTVEYPIKLVLTDGGWRFDQFASASTDCEREGVQQSVLHPLSR